MTVGIRDNFQSGINHYVPGMEYASDLMLNGLTEISLGTPAAISATALDTDIDGDATAGTETAQSWTADSPYGRTLTMVCSGDPGAAAAYDIYGTDYLGQPMIERFTHVNGATDIIYGKKAFYTVTKAVVVTAAANAVTVDLGTGYRLGLPYKGDISWARENGVMVPVYNRDFIMWHSAADVDVTSGFSAFLRAPCPGYVKTLIGQPGGNGSTTNAATTVELGGNAITGLTVTMDQDTTTEVTDTPTTAGYNANNRFIADGQIEIVHAATTSGGDCRFGIEITPTQFVHPDTTDAATVSTGDPRGTYESLAVFDGSKEIVVGMLPDRSVNSSGNGGLHGIQHYYA